VRTLLVFLLLVGCSSLEEKPPRVVPTIVSSPDTVSLEHAHFKISYHKKYRLPKFVAYTITAESLRGPRVKRQDRFIPDPLLQNQGIEAVRAEAYKHSGYDKGHMAPAASFAFDQEASDETFVMSNMVPQTPDLNRHAWKALEDLERRMGCGEEKVLVFTGPVLEPSLPKLPSGLPIPQRFFKLIIDDTPPRKAVAFVYGQKDKQPRIEEHVVAPEEVEKLVGENFENAIPPEDKAIFQVAVSPSRWKQKDCSQEKGIRPVARRGRRFRSGTN
jgi:endonuclease G